MEVGVRRRRRAPKTGARWAMMIAVVGPGLMVMLADTDAGSVVTAAQSGSRFRYAMVLPELLLIPALYLIQEMTVRLGLSTQRGHGALIRQVFGRGWASLSAVTLLVTCVGALITEFAGVAGVGQLVGVSRWVSVGGSVFALALLVLLGRYRRVEHVGIAIGVLELLFIPAAIVAHPNGVAVLHDLSHPAISSSGYFNLLAANVGAVIMPWMIFYQQEAVIDKGSRGLSPSAALRAERRDTGVGAVVTQAIMVAIVVAVGATLGVSHRGGSLQSIGQIAGALTPFLGRREAVLFFGLGMVGASMVAALVVTLAGAWGVSEVMGWRHSLNDSPLAAPGFYSVAVGGILLGGALVVGAPNLVKLSVDVEILNACLLPAVLGFLLALEARALPERLRMRGSRRAITYAVTGLVIAFGLVTMVVNLW